MHPSSIGGVPSRDVVAGGSLSPSIPLNQQVVDSWFLKSSLVIIVYVDQYNLPS